MAQEGGQVLHAERGGTFAPVWVVLAAMALGTAIDAVVRSPDDALSIVVAGTTMLIPVSVYVASKRRYGRLEVTRDTLRTADPPRLACVLVDLVDEADGAREG